MSAVRSVTRRDFVSLVGGVGPALALSWRVDPVATPYHRGILRLDSNENPWGPAPEVIEALRSHLAGVSRYPREHVEGLRATLAQHLSCTPANLLLSPGSTESLILAVEAFVTPTAPLLTPWPSFETPTLTAERLGLPVRRVALDGSLRLDAERLIDLVPEAGLLYLCNPNNPTATIVPTRTLHDLINRVRSRAPKTVILIDEAYHDFVTDPDHRSLVSRAVTEERLLVARTFSKIHGLAGLRAGYLAGHPVTLAAMAPHRLPMGMSDLAAIAASAALTHPARGEWVRTRNRDLRDAFTRQLVGLGRVPSESQANFVFFDAGRDAQQFRAVCRDNGLAIARAFPPFDQHVRITIGTDEEMQEAARILSRILG